MLAGMRRRGLPDRSGPPFHPPSSREVCVPPAISVSRLVKAYDGAPVVDGVSFEVGAGSICALLGPNGAGKTTTVECITGFRIADAGEVRVLGCDPLRNRDAVVARMGVMLQEGGAYQAATPREMLRLYASLYPDPLETEALLERLGLAAVAERRFRLLSGGQKQRLNLALALVGRPRVAVLDEPTAALDPTVRSDVWHLIRGLRGDGVAVLMTTHDLDEAERLADEVVLLASGRIIARDSPAALVAGSAADRVLVTTPAHVDPSALAAGLGMKVEADGVGRWVVHADASAIPLVSAWFSERGLPLTGVTTAGGGLEDVFFRLTSREATR